MRSIKGNFDDSKMPRSLPLGFLLACGIAVAAALMALIPLASWMSAIRLGDGASAELAAGYFRPLLVSTAIISSVMAVLFWRYEELLNRLLERIVTFDSSMRSGPGLREGFAWACLVTLLVLCFDGPSLRWGYFESDDFQLLNDDIDLAIPALLSKTHNDHIIALLRLELRAMRSIFGKEPLAYNAGVLASFMLLLWSGAMLLRECGVRYSVVVAVTLMCVGWTLWGQFTTGDYCYQIYMQISTCAAVSMFAWLRWRKRQGWGSLFAIGLAIMVACWLNLSGFWALFALMGFAAFDLLGRSRDAPSQGRVETSLLYVILLPLIIVLFAATSAAIFDIYAFSQPTSSEFLRDARSERTINQFFSQLAGLFGTSLLSILIPFPHHLSKLGLLTLAICFAICCALFIGWIAMRGLSRDLRSHFIAILVAILGMMAMVAIGRPTHDITHIVPIKFLGPVFFWTCLAIGFLIEGVLRRVFISSSLPRRILSLKVLICLIALTWSTHFIANLACAVGIPFFQVDVTRWALLREHDRVRKSLDSLRRDVIEPLEKASLRKDESVVLKDISGVELCRQYPALRFSWGEERPLSYFRGVLSDHPERLKFISEKQ